MSIKKACCYFVFIGMILLQCGGNETAGLFEELSFAINDSLLGPVYIDSTLGFAFHPPVGWVQVSDTTMGEAHQVLAEKISRQDSIRVAPLRFFINQHKSRTCCLSSVTGLDMSGSAHDRMDTYGLLLQDRFAGAEIVEGTFRVNDINVYQYLITDNSRVIFKLLCQGPRQQTFQVDYVLSQPANRREIQAIESSIGSFQMRP